MNNTLNAILSGTYRLSGTSSQNGDSSSLPLQASNKERYPLPVRQNIDTVTLSSPQTVSSHLKSKNLSINEEQQNLENGFRRLQTFENTKGQKIIRIEEVTSDAHRTRRTVIQQNPSGNITKTESVYDRQEDGTFRVTKRLTNEAGESQTIVEYDVQAPNLDIALGRISTTTNSQDSTSTKRGQAYDVIV